MPKWRVTVYLGKAVWFWDFEQEEHALTKVTRIVANGMTKVSAAGVRTTYPPSRITKVVCKKILPRKK